MITLEEGLARNLSAFVDAWIAEDYRKALLLASAAEGATAVLRDKTEGTR